MKQTLAVISLFIVLAGCESGPRVGESVKDNPGYPSTDDRRIHDQPHRMDPTGPDFSPDVGSGTR